MYIDLLFFTDFLMDCIVLFGARCILGVSVRGRRLACGALVGALGGCVITFFERVGPFLLVLQGVLLSAAMVYVTFRPARILWFVKGICAVYVMGFLTGGVLGWLQQCMPPIPFYCFLALAGGASLCGVRILRSLQERSQRTLRVRLQHDGPVIETEAIVDSGNLLTMPESRETVSVISASVIKQALSECQSGQLQQIFEMLAEDSRRSAVLQKWSAQEEMLASGWRVIFYKSIGCESGALPVLFVRRIILETEQGEILRTDVPVAVSRQDVCAGKRVQMIVSPKILE